MFGSRENCELGEEGSSDGDPVAAAHQLVRLVPHFEGMDVAGIKQRRIGVHDAGRDPSDVPFPFASPRAGLDHALEILVERDPVAPLPDLATQLLAEMNLVEEQDASRGRRYPFQGAEMGEGEQSPAVGFDQRRHRKIVHHAAQPPGVAGLFRVGQVLVRGDDVGEPEAGEGG